MDNDFLPRLADLARQEPAPKKIDVHAVLVKIKQRQVSTPGSFEQGLRTILRPIPWEYLAVSVTAACLVVIFALDAIYYVNDPLSLLVSSMELIVSQ